jgi:hypothetical protein
VPQIVPTAVKINAGAAAPDFARGSKNLRDAAGAVAAIGVVLAQPWAPLAAAFSLTGIAGERLLVPVMEWLGNDPPDEGFDRPVRLKRSHLKPSPALDVDDDAVQRALAAFEHINFSAAALRAMLRAAEREEAASMAGDQSAAERRREDGRRFRVDAVQGLGQTAGSYTALSADQKELASFDERVRPLRPQRRSSQAVRRLLLDSRVPEPLASVHAPSAEWEGFGEAAKALAVAADDCRELAEQLDRWEIVA